GRIVGGKFVPIEDVPWQVAFLENNHFYCGGSILNKWFILTAAHCAYKSNGTTKQNITIRAGSSLKNYGGQLVNVSKIILHEKYNHTTVVNDIAILQLEKPLNTTNPAIQPIELAEKSPSPGTNVLVSGWGSMTNQPFTFQPEILLGVNLTIVDTVSCRKSYIEGNYTFPETVVCAHQCGKDSCQGDSGGPLVTWPNPKLVGIVSGGTDCAFSYPGFYTDQNITIRAGSSLKNYGGQLVNVSKIILHEKYNHTTVVNDIAILKLEKPLDMTNPAIQPIELAEKSPSPGTNVLVSGWGSMTNQPFTFQPEILLGVNLTIVDTVSCRKSYIEGNYTFPETVVCAHQCGKDSCQGDSGGPLVTWPNPKLVGIVSGGTDCALSYPGFYTDVDLFRNWILQTIKE
ncbi:hypothetical protein KR067_012129, partial [Drosophila pandora]